VPKFERSHRLAVYSPASSGENTQRSPEPTPVRHPFAGLLLVVGSSVRTNKMTVTATDDLTELQLRAENGDPRSQYEMGLRCETGEGVPRDPAAAARWILQAANLGLADAQFKAGLICHRRGLGRRNGAPNEAMIEAYKWFKLAASHGSRNARDNRDWAALQMKRAEVAEGDRQAGEFMAARRSSAVGTEPLIV
jgi:TPR repeat protein